MKKEFSTSWASSTQPRKQRKFRYNAPLHLRHKFLSAHLSKELRKKHGKRSIPVRKGDEVLIMRGKFAKKKGKILTVSLATGKVTIDGINRKKIDGTSINVSIQPSNLSIITLNNEDKKRLNKQSGEKKEETKTNTEKSEKAQKPNKQEEKNAPEKNRSK